MYEVSVSVLIPVYNTWKTIGISLDSLIRQTFRDIEVICVDDGSNEETKEVLREYAERDNRIRVITLAQNRGALYARSKAIEAARGEYIMFLDGDDEYTPDACEKAWKAIRDQKVDILQYGTKIVASPEVSQQRIDDFKKYMANPGRKLRGREVFEACFAYGKMQYGWHLWNKIFSARLLKKSLPYTPQERCVIATDFYLYFIAAYFADSFGAVDDELICYNFGSGVSAMREYSLKVYKNNLTRKVACNAIEKFLERQAPADPLYREEFSKWEDEYCRIAVWQFVKNCKLAYSAEAFDALAAAFSLERVAQKFVTVFGTGETVRIAKMIYGARCLEGPPKKVKTVAFFYHRFSNGGVQRVLSKLIPLFIEWGYRTVLFVEEDNPNDYALPGACKKVIIPSSLYGISAEQYADHAAALRAGLIENGVDLFLYQATSSPYFLYDILVSKSAGSKIVGTMHELLAQPLLRSFDTYTRKPYVFRIADGIQTLLRSDRAYLQALGINAAYIPNPATYETKESAAESRDGTILWVGRLSEFQKQTEHAVSVMEKVVQTLPSAHMFIVGKGETDADDKRYAELIEKNGLTENITLVGYLDDPSVYYQRCGVLLITSLFEVSPMVMGEALSNGIPVVSYNMPYVEFLRKGKGVLCIEQGDISGAANALVTVLQDAALQKQMADEALQTARMFERADLRGAWQAYIRSLASPRRGADPDMSICIENMLEFYDYGIAWKKKQDKNRENKLKSEMQKLKENRQKEAGKSKETKQGEDASVLYIADAAPLTLKQKVGSYWVEHGTFATIRKGIVYLYKKIFRSKKKAGRKRQFANYVSLGYNKETDYRLADHLAQRKNAEMLTVPWTYSFEPGKLIDALEHPEKILRGETEFSREGNATVRDKTHALVFQLRGKKSSDYYSDSGLSNKIAMEDTLSRLQEECGDFCSGLQNIFASGKKTLFVIKAKTSCTDFAWIDRLYGFLKKNMKKERFKLLVVAEQRIFEKLKSSAAWHRNSRIVIAKVSNFASDSNVNRSGDIESWYEILSAVEKIK